METDNALDRYKNSQVRVREFMVHRLVRCLHKSHKLEALGLVREAYSATVPEAKEIMDAIVRR